LNLKSDLTYVDASLNLKADINNPNFTGDVSMNNKLRVGSDASFNGDVTITGNLEVKQQQDTSIINTTVNDYTLIVTEDLSLNGNLSVSGDASFNGGLRFGGDIIPTTDSAFDIGTPDLKVRDLYLSNNSLWIGNDHKIDIQDGKMKFRKRKASVIPASVKTAKNDTDENILSDIKTTIGLDESYTTVSQITPGMYLRYARKKGNLTVNSKTGDNITVQDIYGTDVADYEDIQNSDITKEKLSLNDRLTVAKDVSFNSKLFVNGDLSLNGGLFIPDKSINVAALKNNSDTTHKTFVITAGGGVYSIDGVTQDTLLLYRGLKYVFDVNDSSVSSHPFYIQTTSGSYNSSNVYNAGVTNNGATSGTIEFIIPDDAPDTLYYVCGSHSGMGGTINIQNGLNINDKLIVNNNLGVKGEVSFNEIPTAPTAISGTNTTQLATTAFVTDALVNHDGGGGSDIDLTQDITVNSLTVGRGGGNVENNAAFGVDALKNNTSGYYNIALGFEALKGNTSGSNNIAIGYGAIARKNTNYNIAIGSSALKSNTASYNIAIGNSTLINNTGSYNIGIGLSSLGSNKYSLRNTAIGYRALYKNLTYNDDNTALGYNAGHYNVSSKNTFLGAEADVDTQNATWTQSTALGYGSKITASNQIMLGTTTETVVAPGNLNVIGTLSKGSGTFKIDHPLPEKQNTHHLVHSFIEGPRMDNIYSDDIRLINGTAEINLDTQFNMTEGTFVALNRKIRVFTTNEDDWDNVRGKVTDNILKIECQNPGSTALVSYLVIGERQDKHAKESYITDINGQLITEPLKIRV